MISAPSTVNLPASNSRRTGWLLASALLLGTSLLVTTPSRAQDPYQLPPLPRTGDKVDWYSVVSGDTLEAITFRHLGTSRLWRENLRLNPQINNPNLLRIGQRLRVITFRPPEPRRAELTDVSRRVEKQLHPTFETQRAVIGDQLKERDGVRTYTRSSAELTFDDRSRLLVGEDSQIYLKRIDASLEGVSRDSIEIRRGQAEVQSRPERAGSKEIEIVIGDALARPRPDASGLARTRARRPEGGGAQVMVYRGISDVAAAGESVAVPRGMGTSVPEDGPPAPPERLLAAPTAETPARRSSWDFANPRFRWKAVAEAASYSVEICANGDCSQLLRRQDGLGDLSWLPEEALPVGDLYWRVTAVSDSGLDGYPSRPWPLTITQERIDLDPPTVAVAIEGAGRVTPDGVAELAPGASLRLLMHDDVSGVQAVRYRWRQAGAEGSDAWRTWRRGTLAPPEVSPPATSRDLVLEIEAEDRLGRVTETPWSLRVRVDDDQPAPPAVTWTGP